MTSSYFDSRATDWDTPDHTTRANTIAQAILRVTQAAPEAIAVDFGSGTGLLARALAAHVSEVVALDNSPGMLAKLAEKCAAAGITNIRGQLFDIDHDMPAPDSCDLVATLMALHHVRDPARFVRAAWQALRGGGHVAIVDLDLDDGEFHTHAADDVFHQGFSREALVTLLASEGFSSVACETAYHIRGVGRSGNEREFSLFMLTASKPA